MKFNKSIALPIAGAATIVSTWVGMAWAANTPTNAPASVPFTTEQVVTPTPTPPPTAQEAVMATPTPTPAQPAPQQTPTPLPPTGERQPASPPSGKQWQEGPGCDMSVRACTAVDVTDPMPDGCMMYDQLKHECVQWKDSA